MIPLSEQLAANRAGKLYPGQAEAILARLARQSRLFGLGFGLPLGLSLGLAALAIGRSPVGFSRAALLALWPTVFGAVLIGSLCAYGMLYRPRRLVRADLAAGSVSLASGQVGHRAAPIYDDLSFFTIGGVRLKGSRAIYGPLLRQKQPLEAYYLPRSRFVVLMRPLTA